MSTPNNSHTQKTMSFFSNMMDDQLERMDAWLDEMQEWQKKGFERTEDAIDEAADLSKATLSYVERLSDEWAELSTETIRQATDTMKTDE